MRRLALVIPVAAVAAVLAGCGSSSPTLSGSGSSPTTSTPATVTDTVLPPATTVTPATTTPAASGPAVCATAALTVSLGAGDGAAGSVVYPLHFTNKGSAACTIAAFPGVSYVAPGNGVQVGAAATRDGAAGATVTLSPGAEATALLRATNYQDVPAASCRATAVSGFRVYPPDNRAAAYVALPHATKACSAEPGLTVQSVLAGAGS